MLQKAEIEELQNGIWQLDCPNMVLRKNATNDIDVYEGSGYIRRTSEGDLLLKLYSKREVDVARLFRSNGLKSGQLIPDDEYYELSATDIKGRIWEAKYILPDIGGCAGQEGAVVSGRLQELKHTTDSLHPSVRPHSSLNIMFFQDLKIPCNAVQSRAPLSVAASENSTRLWMLRNSHLVGAILKYPLKTQWLIYMHTLISENSLIIWK